MKKIYLFMLMAVGLLISGNVKAGNVCKIGETEYATLAAAVDAVNADGNEVEITLIADDIEPKAVTIAEGKKIKLNLNNHSLSIAERTNLITNQGILTIVGIGVTTGKAGSIAAYSVVINKGNGTLYIDNGTFVSGLVCDGDYDVTGNVAAIRNYGDAKVYIRGGVFCSYDARYTTGSNCLLPIESENAANLQITGGIFSHYMDANVSGSYSSGCGCYDDMDYLSSATTEYVCKKETETSMMYEYEWKCGVKEPSVYTFTPQNVSLNTKYSISEVAYKTSDGTFPFEKAYVVHPKTGSSFTADDDESVALSAGATTIDADQKVAYLEIGSGATLTVKDGKTLTIGDYGLAFKDATSKLIIEPGAIVKVGAAGVLADDYVNITMQMSNEKSSQLIFSPEINLNYQPKATAVYTPTSYQVSEEKKINGHFGIPFASGVTDLTSNNSVEVGFAGYKYGEKDGYWETLGYLNPSSGHNPVNKSAFNAYTYYQLLCKAAAGHGTELTFTGNLMGNTNYWFDAIGYSWNGYANSYTGQIDIAALINGLDPKKIDRAVYVIQNSGTDSYTWEVVNILTSPITKIQPMQAFLIRNTKEETAQSELSYENVVYTPFTKPSKAPQVITSDMSTMNIIVTDPNGFSDHVFLAEGQQFSAEYENGYDAAKFMNPTINIYAIDEEDMAILATDDLQNTYLGFSCKNAGEYTLHFDQIQGQEYCLIDLLNNISTSIKEGTTYSFTATDNMTEDYRFMIIADTKAPTAISNVNSKAFKYGIYSIMGQRIGDVHVWNNLPKGVYIVNGQRIIK